MIGFRIGDVFDRLAEIPGGSVDLIVTSPPFLALRSYLPDDHPEKHRGSGARYQRARNLCAQCPVQAECLNDALEWERRHRLDDITGYRGGMSANQRRHIVETERRGVA